MTYKTGLEKEYYRMKNEGRCPYDSLEEYIESFLWAKAFENRERLANETPCNFSMKIDKIQNER